MTFKHNVIGGLAATCLVATVTATATAAEKYSVPINYALVEATFMELEEMHKAGGTKPHVEDVSYAIGERKPRHVIQKAREVLKKVEYLRKMKGLEDREVKPIPAHAITPKEVYDYLNNIEHDLRDLRPKYGIKTAVPHPPVDESKTPADVYARLHDVSLSLDGLGVRPVRAFDVYRVAMIVIADLERIRDKVGVSGKVQVGRVRAKRIRDVYEQSHKLLGDLNALTKKAKYTIPGGVVIPGKAKGKVDAHHVMDVLNKVLGDLMAVKVKVGDKSASTFAMPKSGRIPTNVYAAILMARKLVKQLKG